MIKILLKSDWKRFNIKMKQQREKLREQHSVLLQQENEIANLRATILGLNKEVEERLGKYIASSGLCSRRKADELILERKNKSKWKDS